MQEKIKIINTFNGDKKELTFESVKKCPKCHSYFVPSYAQGFLNIGKVPKVEILCYCKNCNSSFIATYNVLGNPDNYQINVFNIASVKCEPLYPENKVFSENINNISPDFQIIYNQANEAECHSLDQIAGMGYRKSLEFLVKDFCIYQNPNEKENIKKMLLKKCIDTYILDNNIKSLATASTFLGNDETHYVRKFENRDIDDLKRFINALLYFIEYNLASIEAIKLIEESKNN